MQNAQLRLLHPLCLAYACSMVSSCGDVHRYGPVHDGLHGGQHGGHAVHSGAVQSVRARRLAHIIFSSGSLSYLSYFYF
jgi:hypothetical protein